MGELFALIKGGKSSGFAYSLNEWNGGRIEVSEEVEANLIKSINAEIIDFQVDDKIKSNCEFDIHATLYSKDYRPGLFAISLYVDEVLHNRKWVWLLPGEKKEVNIIAPKLFYPKKYSIKLNDYKAKDINLTPSDAKLKVISVNLPKFEKTKRVNETINIEAEFKNIGSYKKNFNILLKSNGEYFSEQKLSLEPGEEKKIEFNYTSSIPGNYKISIDDQWTSNVKFYNENINSEYLKYSFEKFKDNIILDESGLNNNAEIKFNSDGNAPQFVNGIYNRSIKFNGKSSYLNIPTFLLKFPMTITLWVKPDTLLKSSTAGRQMIIYASEEMGNDGYGPEDEIHLMRATGNSFSFWSNTSNKVLDLRYPFDNENEWYFIAVVYDSTSKMYVNGKLVSEINGIAKPKLENISNQIYIGRPTVNYLRYFNGELDELYFYNEVLSANEIFKIYESYTNSKIFK